MPTGPETAPDCERPRARHRTWGRWSGDVPGLRPANLDGVSWSPRLAQAFRLTGPAPDRSRPTVAGQRRTHTGFPRTRRLRLDISTVGAIPSTWPARIN